MLRGLPGTRRTQAERRAATQGALLDAAVRSLWELFRRPDLLALVRLEWDHEQRTRDLAEELLLPHGGVDLDRFRLGVAIVVDAVQSPYRIFLPGLGM